MYLRIKNLIHISENLYVSRYIFLLLWRKICIKETEKPVHFPKNVYVKNI